jgi:hypothetical protein
VANKALISSNKKVSPLIFTKNGELFTKNGELFTIFGEVLTCSKQISTTYVWHNSCDL